MKGKDKNGEKQLDLLYVERRKERKKERISEEEKLYYQHICPVSAREIQLL